MRTFVRSTLPFFATMACLAASNPASAQEEEASDPWSVDATVAVVSDYRFRGISLSDKDPALQTELYLTHESGLYVGFWGSTMADNGGDNIEMQPSIGFARTIGPVDIDISAAWYLYPGVSSWNYLEFYSTASVPAGPVTLGIEADYAPAQKNLGDEDNLYLAMTASAPLGILPISLNGSFGFEDGALADKKRDWSLGISGELAGFELGAAYVDAAHHGHDPLADPTVVLSIKKSF